MSTRRYDMRIPTSIRVKVRGTDRDGNSFEQTARTINVSRTGARLDGIGCLDRAQTVEVKRGWFHKARFRVMWSGMPGTNEAGQVGLRLLDSDSSFWGIPFPPSAPMSEYVPPQSTGAPAIPASGPIPVDWSAPAAPAAKRTAAAVSSSFGGGSNMPYMGPTIQETEVVDLTWQKPATPATGRTIRERVAAVAVRWTDASGMAREESCEVARVLRDKSCIVPMKTALREGDEVTLVNTRTGGTRPATVSMCGPQLPDNSYPIAIDLAAPDTQFWGSGNSR